MSMIEPVPVGRVRCEVDEEARVVRTTFPDGRALVARPVMNAENVSRANALGYRDVPYFMDTQAEENAEAVWAMTRQHDALHVLLAEAVGQRYSLSLHYAALDIAPSSMQRAEMDREEHTVLLMQRLMNVGIDTLMAERDA